MEALQQSLPEGIHHNWTMNRSIIWTLDHYLGSNNQYPVPYIVYIIIYIYFFYVRGSLRIYIYCYYPMPLDQNPLSPPSHPRTARWRLQPKTSPAKAWPEDSGRARSEVSRAWSRGAEEPRSTWGDWLWKIPKTRWKITFFLAMEKGLWKMNISMRISQNYGTQLWKTHRTMENHYV